MVFKIWEKDHIKHVRDNKIKINLWHGLTLATRIFWLLFSLPLIYLMSTPSSLKGTSGVLFGF